MPYFGGMEVVLRNARIADSASPFNGERMDLYLKAGTIVSIDKDLEVPEGVEEIRSPDLHVSPGWCELHSDFADPGQEEREDLRSGSAAAAQGGFTAVALVPSTQPVIQTKSDVEYILSRTKGEAVACYPLGALSRYRKGEELAEFFELKEAGAVGLYDDQPLPNTKLLQLALQYGQNAGARVFSRPDDAFLARGGQMHEGPVSTLLGLRGLPPNAEVMGLMRDLELVRYTGAAIHFTNISTAQGVELIRKAKDEGLPVTADVAIANLAFTDAELENYDTRYKVYPPLRDEEHRQALWLGVKDGTLDAITCNHSPQDIEHKQCEFDHAAFGMITLETAYSLAVTYGNIDPDLWVARACINPRALLDLPLPTITEGALADLTFFDPSAEYKLEKHHLRSRSANTPLVGRTLKGKVLGIYANGTFVPGA